MEILEPDGSENSNLMGVVCQCKRVLQQERVRNVESDISGLPP